MSEEEITYLKYNYSKEIVFNKKELYKWFSEQNNKQELINFIEVMKQKSVFDNSNLPKYYNEDLIKKHFNLNDKNSIEINIYYQNKSIILEENRDYMISIVNLITNISESSLKKILDIKKISINELYEYIEQDVKEGEEGEEVIIFNEMCKMFKSKDVHNNYSKKLFLNKIINFETLLKIEGDNDILLKNTNIFETSKVINLNDNYFYVFYNNFIKDWNKNKIEEGNLYYKDNLPTINSTKNSDIVAYKELIKFYIKRNNINEIFNRNTQKIIANNLAIYMFIYSDSEYYLYLLMDYVNKSDVRLKFTLGINFDFKIKQKIENTLGHANINFVSIKENEINSNLLLKLNNFDLIMMEPKLLNTSIETIYNCIKSNGLKLRGSINPFILKIKNTEVKYLEDLHIEKINKKISDFILF